MKRYDCLKILASMMTENDLVVTNIGTVQHEWRVARPSRANLYGLNMGQCTAVALGLSLALPKRRVFALDGDGSLLLNLVALGDVAYHKPAKPTRPPGACRRRRLAGLISYKSPKGPESKKVPWLGPPRNLNKEWKWQMTRRCC